MTDRINSEAQNFAQRFWNGKILNWEAARYDREVGKDQWLERIATRSSHSVRYRMERAKTLLIPRVKDRVIVELGCGTGRLAEPLLAAGAKHYIGIDFAPSAIEQAQNRIATQGLSSQAEFQVQSIDQTTPPSSPALVFSLGLLDWLNDEQLAFLFQKWSGIPFLHSFSERRLSPGQWLHRLYVYLAYGHRSQGYSPRYYSAAKLIELAQRSGAVTPSLQRDPALSFGTFLLS